jgi:Mitochondrial domain of unknown function (DUF1713)
VRGSDRGANRLDWRVWSFGSRKDVSLSSVVKKRRKKMRKKKHKKLLKKTRWQRRQQGK